MCICVACIVSKKNCSGVVKQAGKKFTPKKKKKSFCYCNQEEIKTKGRTVLNTRGSHWKSTRSL